MALQFSNTRPVAPANDELQDYLDSITDSGPGIDAVNDQIDAAYFSGQSSGGAVATFMVENAGWAGSSLFGIYSLDDPTNKALIFDGPDTAGAQKLVSFLANGDIQVNGATVATGFSDLFGFYLDVYQNQATLQYTVFSDDSLNSGRAQALIIQGKNDTTIHIDPFGAGVFAPDEFIVAWEDQRTGDADYNDGVFMIESVTPAAVPEPATMMLLGSGLLGLAAAGRRKFFKK